MMQNLLQKIQSKHQNEENMADPPIIRVKGPLQIFAPRNDKVIDENHHNKPKTVENFAISELLKFATEIKKDNSNPKRQQTSQKALLNVPWPDEKQGQILIAFETLFDLYIKEEILKQYCAKLEWKFQERLINTFVTPYIDMLGLNEKKIQNMFEPFLKEITAIYLLYTSLDTYSRLTPSELICEMSKTWIEIRKAEIVLKGVLRYHVQQFTQFFSKKNPKTQKTGEDPLSFDGSSSLKNGFDRKKFFKYLFIEKEKRQTNRKMTCLIKVFIFCHRVFGVELDGNILNWINEE